MYKKRCRSLEKVVQDIVIYMEENFSEKIRIYNLARQMNISESALLKAFKKETGMTPMKYLLKVRVEKSKLLLRNKECSINEIAFRCGFYSSAHFSNTFHKKVGIAPKEYEKLY